MNDLLQAARAHPAALRELRRLVAFPELPPGTMVPPVEVSTRDLDNLQDSDLAAIRRLIPDQEELVVEEPTTARCTDCGTPIPEDPTFSVLRCPPCGMRAGRATGPLVDRKHGGGP